MPDNARRHQTGCQSAIYLLQPGANTRVRSWCPTPGAQYGFLVTHNESISIADYFTVGSPEAPAFRPTCPYASHPCNDRSEGRRVGIEGVSTCRSRRSTLLNNIHTTSYPYICQHISPHHS